MLSTSRNGEYCTNRQLCVCIYRGIAYKTQCLHRTGTTCSLLIIRRAWTRRYGRQWVRRILGWLGQSPARFSFRNYTQSCEHNRDDSPPVGHIYAPWPIKIARTTKLLWAEDCAPRNLRLSVTAFYTFPRFSHLRSLSRLVYCPSPIGESSYLNAGFLFFFFCGIGVDSAQNYAHSCAIRASL